MRMSAIQRENGDSSLTPFLRLKERFVNNNGLTVLEVVGAAAA
jgi:hypothetical protein